MMRTSNDSGFRAMRAIFAGAAFLLAIGAGFAAGQVMPHSHKQTGVVRGSTEDYAFINPLLECELADGTLDATKMNLSQELKAHVERLKKNGEITEMGVYVRDLNNGPTFGVGEDEGFLPASLLKLPVAMAFYKIAEDDPSVLARRIRFEKKSGPPEDGDIQFIRPTKEIEPGREYRIDELIEATLVYSDNQAIQLLYDELNRTSAKPLRDLYRLLGVDESVLNGPGGRLSVKQYSAFFRILFNASFLDRKHSEHILATLARSDYDRALAAGVPDGIPISHKFGESGTLKERQIHDCGIVYYPDHPYLLCVMSRGAEAEKLEWSIASVAAFLSERLAPTE